RDRPEDGEVVEGGPVGGAVLEEGSLLLVEERPHGPLAEHGFLHLARTQLRLEPTGADEAAGHGVDLHPEALEAAQVAGHLARHHGPQLHHAVVAARGPASTDDDTVLVESQVRRVEEEDLTYLGLEGVHLEGLDRGPWVT